MQFNKTWTPLATDADAIANDVTAAAGTAFTLITDELSDGLAHILTFTPSGSVTGSYSVSGLDADGNAVSETVATDTVNAVSTTKYYRSDIVVLAPSGLGAETVDIGYTAVAASQSIGLEKFSNATAAISIDVSGTINFTVQETPEDFYNSPQQNGVWSSITALSSKTADTVGSSTESMRCLRVIFNSLNAGATLRACVAQGIAM